jgi:phosphopantetheine adenylyltransferase
MKFTDRILAIVGFVVCGMLISSCMKNQLEDEELEANDRSFQIADEAEVIDTEKTRAVLNVLSRYRQAVVDKDFGTIKKLVSQDYYDNAGTTDTTEDDYGWSELKKQILEMMAEHTDEIKYDMLIQNVEVKKGTAYIDYEYDFAYRYKVGETQTWDAGLETNRVELQKEDGKWRITSGL